jgi:hypothetical protein
MNRVLSIDTSIAVPFDEQGLSFALLATLEATRYRHQTLVAAL